MSNQYKVVINGAFRGQRITGQQRYANEIASELLAHSELCAYELAPKGWWQRGPIRAWLWVQTLPFRVPRNVQILTLTSRGPILCRRQIIVIHDLFVLTNPKWFSKKYVWTHAPILKIQMMFANAFVAVSEPVANEVRKRISKDTPLTVASNAPSPIFATSNIEYDRRILESKALVAGKFLLSVASLDPRKNIESQVKAFLSLPVEVRKEFPLILVGGESSSFNNVLIDTDETIVRLGYVSDEELGILYRNARLLIFATLDEGFGLPAVEALGAGTPVLTSDIPVMRWVCGPHATYIDPRNSEDIARGLLDMIGGGTESSTRRNERSEYVSNRFSWEQSASAIVKMIQDEEL